MSRRVCAALVADYFPDLLTHSPGSHTSYPRFPRQDLYYSEVFDDFDVETTWLLRLILIVTFKELIFGEPTLGSPLRGAHLGEPTWSYSSIYLEHTQWILRVLLVCALIILGDASELL